VYFWTRGIKNIHSSIKTTEDLTDPNITYKKTVDMNLKLLVILVVVLRALDVLITKYAIDNSLMRELNPYFDYSLLHQLPLIIGSIAMVWVWSYYSEKVSNSLMIVFILTFSFPVVNNTAIIILSGF
jgi:hypothetical protein